MKIAIAFLSLLFSVFSLIEKVNMAEADVVLQVQEAGKPKDVIIRLADILLMRAVLLPIEVGKLNESQKKEYENIRSVFSRFADNDNNGKSKEFYELKIVEKTMLDKMFSAAISPAVSIPFLISIISFLEIYREWKAKRSVKVVYARNRVTFCAYLRRPRPYDSVGR